MEGIIPIRTLLDAGSFNPDEIRMLVSVFEDALRELQLNDPGDPAAAFVAQRIISPRRTRPRQFRAPWGRARRNQRINPMQSISLTSMASCEGLHCADQP
jgi:hypothetical protein